MSSSSEVSCGLAAKVRDLPRGFRHERTAISCIDHPAGVPPGKGKLTPLHDHLSETTYNEIVPHERYAYRDGKPRFGFQGFYWLAVIAIPVGMWLGPQPLKRPLTACLLVLMGVSGIVCGDRWGFTESRSRAERILGRTIMLVFAGAMFFAAYNSITDK